MKNPDHILWMTGALLLQAWVPGLAMSASPERAGQPLIEEILVTAQRVEERENKVPIAMSAFTDTDIEDKRIIGIGDLSLFVPSLSYTTTNIGDANISIRGVGSLVSVAHGESGVSLHVNEIPLAPGQPPLELYDLSRIEVLRGPQSTLYGRNATGGVVNLITAKPSFDGPGGYLDLETGNEDLLRIRGSLSATIGEAIAFRLAGLFLERDGYTDNLAGGQVPGAPSEIDGRDLYSLRGTATWRLSERTEASLFYERFDENDDRMLTHNRRCVTATAPVTRHGCEPGEFGLEAHNPNQPRINTFIANGLRGIIPLGARDAQTGLVFRYPRPHLTGLRDVHLDLAPSYEFKQNSWQLRASHVFEWGSLSFIGGYQDWELRRLQDSDWGVGHELAPIPEQPNGLWPVSALPPGKDALDGPVCNVNAGQAGVLGDCVFGTFTRQFWYGEEREWRDAYSLELKLRSNLDGQINFLVGANHQESDSHQLSAGGTNDYWETWTLIGSALVADPAADPFGLALDPALRLYIGSLRGSEQKVRSESFSVFSEVYFKLTERLKLTVAGRYNWDEKRIAARGGGLALDLNPFVGGTFGEPVWVRTPALDYATGTSSDSSLLDFYRLTEDVDAARASGDPLAVLDAVLRVPLLQAWNEDRVLAGVPDEFDWSAWSGRLVLDWQASEDVLAYASYARGYKPGGFNDAGSINPDYRREDVNSYEVGLKSRLAGNSLSFSAAAFFNDYKDLQLTNLSLEQFRGGIENSNVDAEIYGAEVEARWRPFFAPRADLELGYSWLNTRLKNEAPRIDPLWLTNGDQELIELFSFATYSGSASGRYVARVDDVLPLVDAAIAAGAALGPDQAPAAIYPSGIPALFDGLFLVSNDVEIQPGVPVEISGNSVPDTAEHTVHGAASYTWDVPFGFLTARWDYYWQSNSYLTIFNRSVESTGSWDQHNASLILESPGGRWSVRAWIRNIENDVHILGGYRQQTAQSFSVSEPRAYGVSGRYNFGAY